MNFQLNYPEKIIFGKNASRQLPELLPADSKVMLVTGKSTVRNGLADKFLRLLRGREQATEGPSAMPRVNCYPTKGGWTSGGACPTKWEDHPITKSPNHQIIDATGLTLPEPPLENVDQLIELGRKENVTAVVAVGGGSTIDAAKAAAAIIPFPGTTSEYFNEERKLTAKGLFFAALPTTAGSGAEITKNAVLTDSAGKVKKSIRSPYMVPDLAIVDPLLTISMPPSLTAASGLDALTQAIESYTSSAANAVTRALAKSAVQKIMGSLLRVYQDGNDIVQRGNMAEGSLLSAMAFSQSGLGAVHGLAHPIGSLLGLAHGLTCSILLPPIMNWNLPVCRDLYNELAAACNLTDAESMVSEITGLRSAMDLPADFRQLGLKKEHFPFIITNCRSNSMKCTPRQMTDQDVIHLLNTLK